MDEISQLLYVIHDKFLLLPDDPVSQLAFIRTKEARCARNQVLGQSLTPYICAHRKNKFCQLKTGNHMNHVLNSQFFCFPEQVVQCIFMRPHHESSTVNVYVLLTDQLWQSILMSWHTQQKHLHTHCHYIFKVKLVNTIICWPIFREALVLLSCKTIIIKICTKNIYISDL